MLSALYAITAKNDFRGHMYVPTSCLLLQPGPALTSTHHDTVDGRTLPISGEVTGEGASLHLLCTSVDEK